jgi:hypothetical protein
MKIYEKIFWTLIQIIETLNSTFLLKLKIRVINKDQFEKLERIFKFSFVWLHNISNISINSTDVHIVYGCQTSRYEH